MVFGRFGGGLGCFHGPYYFVLGFMVSDHYEITSAVVNAKWVPSKKCRGFYRGATKSSIIASDEIKDIICNEKVHEYHFDYR